MMEMLSFLPDPRFMRAALQIAKEAAAEGEIPVGAVIVRWRDSCHRAKPA